MAKLIKNERRNNVPVVDLNQPPLMDVNQIMAYVTSQTTVFVNR